MERLAGGDGAYTSHDRAVTATDPVPVSPRAASGSELKAHIDAERAGLPFLVYRDEHRQQVIFVLADRGDRIVLGRSPSADVPLTWDEQVSRAHAELCRVGSEWVIVDDGLSRNGSVLNGKPVRRRQRLHDGDTVRLGNTLLLFRDPGEAHVRSTTPTGERERIVALSDLQQQVLVALCRPFKASTSFVTPATNEEIASEVFLSVDAVKKHMRVLFEKFGVEDLPQYEKRSRLVERAFAAGFVSEHEL
jgi:pSer/pThr/pTyr-binding forkhead associated (FHA) protein